MQRMQDVFNNMLDILKIESQALNPYMEPVSISALIRQIINQLVDVLDERNLILVPEEAGEVPFIEGDIQILEKVFFHLLSNAVKYTPDGGLITINTQLIKATEEDGEASVDRVEIRIRDTGIGIEPAVQSLIFEKFYQTGKIDLHSSSQTEFKGGGPGLGLAIAKGLVEAHHGRIWVESTGFDETNLPGSTFYIHLPVRQN
jgi:signal transduction histidine kinase